MVPNWPFWGHIIPEGFLATLVGSGQGHEISPIGGRGNGVRKSIQFMDRFWIIPGRSFYPSRDTRYGWIMWSWDPDP